MLFTSFRSDPFSQARQDAGLEPTTTTRRLPAPPAARRGVAMGVATVLVSLAAVLFGSVSPVSGAPDEVAAKESALDRASADRAAAEVRVADAAARLTDVQGELRELGANDEKLTAEIAAARRDLREYAVAAYIDGGQTEIFISSLAPEKAVVLSWQANMALGQSVSADEAAARFEALKAANGPAMVEAAAELDRVSTELQEARYDAIQAAAHERDAESALARARADAERARLERAAAERSARAAAKRSAASTPATQPTPARGPGRTQSPAPPAPSGVRGNPTAAESATLARIRRCESGGNYSVVSSSGRYRGAYQFDRGTWASVGGVGDPAAASPAEQDYRALLLLRQRGTRPWPHCGR